MLYLWYLVPLALVVIGVIADTGILALAGFLGALILAYLFHGLDPLYFIAANPVPVIFIILGYLVAGASWAWIKFELWLMGQSEDMKKEFEEYQRQHPGKSLPEFKQSYAAKQWSPSANKGRILEWMAYWPFSMFWTFTHDFFVNVWRWVYTFVSGMFERATERAFDRYLKK